MQFKVGNRVKCVYNDNGSQEYVGTVGTITAIDGEKNHPYYVSFCRASFAENELALVCEKYKVGQKFTTDWSPTRFGGATLEIIKNNQTGTYPYRVKVVKKGCGYEPVGTTWDWNSNGKGDMIIKCSNSKSPMKYVNIMMKKLLDKDTQTLVKAGYINGDLEITEDGQKALYALIFADKKPDLVALAQEQLDEEKADKCN